MKYGRQIEKYYPFALSLIICVIIYIFRNEDAVITVFDNLFCLNLLSLIITIESILVGFLLTVLSLVVQMDNKAIAIIKKWKKYGDLISYGKSAIYTALLTVFMSLIYLLSEFSTTSIAVYIWSFLFLASILTLYRFVKIFFILAQSGK